MRWARRLFQRSPQSARPPEAARHALADLHGAHGRDVVQSTH